MKIIINNRDLYNICRNNVFNGEIYYLYIFTNKDVFEFDLIDRLINRNITPLTFEKEELPNILQLLNNGFYNDFYLKSAT